MKVKVLSRNPDDYVRETKHDIHKLPRNYAPELHPFQANREYVRALNATKLERVFAKPFLGSLDGHTDGIQCIVKHPSQLSTVLSGAYDGEVRIWNISRRQCLQTVQAHSGYCRGICVDPLADSFFTVGDDKCIKQWTLHGAEEPLNTIISKYVLYDITHHWKQNVFATCGELVQIWDHQRAAPVREFSWGVDTVSKLRFNPVEADLLGGVANDRSVLLYDCRGQVPLRKVVLKLRSNALAWNPMEAYTFTVANEDYNLYTFDMRNLSVPQNVHMNHIAAVMDVDYAPTGREFVSGSYDKTVRIWPCDHGRSREVYHTKRMQRVMTVAWSADNKYILSGSDEMNIRVWKAKAWEKLGPLRPRESMALQYNERLKEKYAHHPEIRRIARHRHVPKHVYNAHNELRTIHESKKRKEANLRAHSKPGKVPYVAERRKHTVAEQE